jgi:predicted nucleic acid-binding protein
VVARTTPLRGAFLDTSVILAGLIDFGVRSASAQRLFELIAAGRVGRPRTAWQCCLEVYSLATRLPQEFRLSPADAVALLAAEVMARFDIADLPPGQRGAFLALCGRAEVRGGRLYDAHVAAIARASGARVVVTDNRRDFAVLEREGIRVIDAAEATRMAGPAHGKRSRRF